MSNYDFSGWVTKNDILCTDGRIIRRDAFKEQNGARVPLVFQHSHNDPSNVLGYIDLENRPEGVYGRASFNGTTKAQDTKELLRHGDLTSLSIHANGLVQRGNDVLHGIIREVSIVLAGANAGAKIDNLYFEHSDGTTDVDYGEAIIYPNLEFEVGSEEEFEHSDETEEVVEDLEHADKTEGETEMANEKSIKKIIDSMTEEQKQALYTVVGLALNKQDEEGEEDMKHNAFDSNYNTELSHDAMEFKQAVLSELSPANRNRSAIGSLADFIEHAAATYGIQDIEWLFPDARTLQNEPDFIRRDDNWVGVFMSGTKHLPFSRVKTMFADITAEEARAKGYTKGNKKLEEVFTLAKRSVDPTTIYKKQKLDRDDELDITSFDVIAFMKKEMRIMLDEEIARAALIGDGRLSSSNDKINESKIIPIWKDNTLFTIPVTVNVKANDTDAAKAEAIIKAVLKARKDYKGSGNLTAFMTEDMLTEMLLLEDGIGRRKYEDETAVARALRVRRIVTVPVMENQTRVVDTKTLTLHAIIVDLNDYAFGADKGGEVNMFDDFDIDFNQKKFLIETRCSGALTKAFSAMVVETTVVSG